VDEMVLDSIHKALPDVGSLSKLVPVEFEKDDDANFHMDFITACSNLRASNYSIATADRYQTKLIAVCVYLHAWTGERAHECLCA